MFFTIMSLLMMFLSTITGIKTIFGFIEVYGTSIEESSGLSFPLLETITLIMLPIFFLSCVLFSLKE